MYSTLKEVATCIGVKKREKAGARGSKQTRNARVVPLYGEKDVEQALRTCEDRRLEDHVSERTGMSYSSWERIGEPWPRSSQGLGIEPFAAA